MDRSTESKPTRLRLTHQERINICLLFCRPLRSIDWWRCRKPDRWEWRRREWRRFHRQPWLPLRTCTNPDCHHQKVLPDESLLVVHLVQCLQNCLDQSSFEASKSTAPGLSHAPRGSSRVAPMSVLVSGIHSNGMRCSRGEPIDQRDIWNLVDGRILLLSHLQERLRINSRNQTKRFLPDGSSSVSRMSNSMYLVWRLTILSRIKMIAGTMKKIQNLGAYITKRLALKF